MPTSPALTAVLYDLSRQIPQLKKEIQDGLLKMLSLVLMHKPLRHPGMPKGLAHQLASPSLTNLPEAGDVGSITLALRTLGSFEFEGKGVTGGGGYRPNPQGWGNARNTAAGNDQGDLLSRSPS